MFSFETIPRATCVRPKYKKEQLYPTVNLN